MKVVRLVFAAVIGMALVSCSTETASSEGTDSSPVSEVSTEASEDEQAVQVVTLNQIPGEFTNGDLTLTAGTYKFEVQNSGVDHEVGLVVAPKKDEITEADHLQNAYVAEVVKDGDTQACKGEVVLEKGEYVFFCPLNPTPQYTITVE